MEQNVIFTIYKLEYILKNRYYKNKHQLIIINHILKLI